MNGAASSTYPRAAAAVDNRRSAPRHPCSDPVWWKAANQHAFQHGWLIERSTSGMAFLTRGPISISDGEDIEMSTSTPTDISFHIQRGKVSRINHVHADLYLIATELGRA
jgi:hypothetical protein